MRTKTKFKKVRIYVPHGNGHENRKSNNMDHEGEINAVSTLLARDFGIISILETFVLHQNEYNEIRQARTKILEFFIPENQESWINRITQNVKSKLNQESVFSEILETNGSILSEY